VIDRAAIAISVASLRLKTPLPNADDELEYQMSMPPAGGLPGAFGWRDSMRRYRIHVCLIAQSEATRKGLAGSTSRLVEFLLRARHDGVRGRPAGNFVSA
jgi:hypothetical protein